MNASSKAESGAGGARDESVLLEFGFTPDRPEEAVHVARQLFKDGALDAAAEAVVRARELLDGPGTEVTPGERAPLELMALRIAIARGDALAATHAANALHGLDHVVPAADLEQVLGDLAGCRTMRPEMREAIAGVVQAVRPGADRPEPQMRSEGPSALPALVAPAAAAPDGLPLVDDDGDALDDLPPTDAPEDEEEDLPWISGADDWSAPAAAAAPEPAAAGEDDPWMDLGDVQAEEAERPPLPGKVFVELDASLPDVIERFLKAHEEAAPDSGKVPLERGWSMFMMNNYDAAIRLFGEAVRDPSTRLGAVEGIVRSYLALKQPGVARQFLERLKGLCYETEPVPEQLLYWGARAAEDQGDYQAARLGYAAVSDQIFPDAKLRMMGLVR